MPVKAYGLQDDMEADVVNPGDWFGKVWLVRVGYAGECSYAVEADSMSDAIDTLAESDEHGPVIRIKEADYGDYGHELSPGDIVGGQTITEKSWYNLRGEMVKGPLKEPGIAGDGTLYDDTDVMVYGQEGAKLPWPCVYSDPDDEFLFDEPISPLSYPYREEMFEERKALRTMMVTAQESGLTVGHVRKAIEGLDDSAPVFNDVLQGPDEYTVNILGFAGDTPKHWQGVANASEIPKALWIHTEIMDMNDEDEDGEEDDEDEEN